MSNMLKVKDAAEKLQVSVATVYLLCSHGQLPHVRVGARSKGTIRIKEEDLTAFVESSQAQAHRLTNAAGLKHIKVPSSSP